MVNFLYHDDESATDVQAIDVCLQDVYKGADKESRKNLVLYLDRLFDEQFIDHRCSLTSGHAYCAYLLQWTESFHYLDMYFFPKGSSYNDCLRFLVTLQSHS